MRAFQGCFLAMAASFALWGLGGGYGVLLAFSVVLGIGYGGFVAIGPAVVAERFGTTRLGGLLGVLYTSVEIGSAFGAPPAGAAVEASGCEVSPVRELGHAGRFDAPSGRLLGRRRVTRPEDRGTAGRPVAVPGEAGCAIVEPVRGPVGREDDRMDVEWGPDAAWGTGPRLDEFLLARIAEDKRVATEAAGAFRDDAAATGPLAEYRGHFDPAHVLAECSAKRGIVLACRAARPDMAFVGSRPPGMGDFPLTPTDQHQLAALTLALLALPYAGHRDYQEQWRP